MKYPKRPKDWTPPEMPEHLKGLYSKSQWAEIAWVDHVCAEREKERRKHGKTDTGGSSLYRG